MSIDFTKAEIGQPVTCLLRGKGKVDLIQENNYPIKVVFDSGKWENFTRDGRLYREYNPSLIVGYHDLPKLDQGKLPRKEPKLLEWKGEFVWAYVGNDYESAIERGKRHVIGFIKETGVFFVVNHGDPFSKITGNASIWKHAWEIEDD